MGWNETDQEEYEITEADKKMFQDLYSKQVRFILIGLDSILSININVLMD